MGELKGAMTATAMRMSFGYFGLKVRVRVAGSHLPYNKRSRSVLKGLSFTSYRKGGKARRF